MEDPGGVPGGTEAAAPSLGVEPQPPQQLSTPIAVDYVIPAIMPAPIEASWRVLACINSSTEVTAGFEVYGSLMAMHGLENCNVSVGAGSCLLAGQADLIFPH